MGGIGTRWKCGRRAWGWAPAECFVFVPEGSNMKGAGKDGADFGANILYRYENGVLTDEPLWDPATRAFPHDSVIAGINDVPGDSLFGFHIRVNVTPNGCVLSYARSPVQ